MKKLLAQFGQSRMLDESVNTPRLVDKELADLHTALKTNAPKDLRMPPFLHEQIMRSVHSERNNTPSRQLLVPKFAITVSFASILLTAILFLSLRNHTIHSAVVQETVSAPPESQTFDLATDVPAILEPISAAPLNRELNLLEVDLSRNVEFLVGSLP